MYRIGFTGGYTSEWRKATFRERRAATETRQTFVSHAIARQVVFSNSTFRYVSSTSPVVARPRTKPRRRQYRQHISRYTYIFIYGEKFVWNGIG